MNTFDIILQQVGLFVLYILAGLLLVKTKVLNRETLEPISKFVIKMALPLMVFINITDGTDKKNLYESWPILVIDLKCFSGKWNFVCFSIYAYRPVYAVDSRCEADISDG